MHYIKSHSAMRFVTRAVLTIICLNSASQICNAQQASTPKTLSGTKPLNMQGDLASKMIDGIDRFLLKEIQATNDLRQLHWKPDFTSAITFNKSIEPNRKQLAHILGLRDSRITFVAPTLTGNFDANNKSPSLIAKGNGFDVYTIRWPVISHPHPNIGDATIYGEGLLLVPTKGKPLADIVAIPHCDQTPEQLAGLEKGIPLESQFARLLAQSGCRVIVPMLIGRTEVQAKLTWREYLYRPSFELGRQLLGYELQKVLACVDWFEREAKSQKRSATIGVIGYGEGGMLALYAGAVDPRINLACVSGYFDLRHDIWQQPIDRNVFGLLNEFPDAKLAAMHAYRHLIVDAAAHPIATWPGGRGAPARIATPSNQRVKGELTRAYKLLPSKLHNGIRAIYPATTTPTNTFLDTNVLSQCAASLNLPALNSKKQLPKLTSQLQVSNIRHRRQAEQILKHNQALLDKSQVTRQGFMRKLNDEIPNGIEAYNKVKTNYREVFRDDVIGSFSRKLLPVNPRSRVMLPLKQDATIKGDDQIIRYEVVLDVFPDVFAYGILTLPKNMKLDGSEKRPVVVCQHGLEGRPQSTIGKDQFQYYKAFSTTLAQRGFITFAPQNIYIFRDRFRTLQRKANTLGKTLFSIMVPQHQQITNWLKAQPFVDSKRIAFYGLSYGGKSAMRIPPLVDNYCLSICSADFNDWVWKNASTSAFANRYTYANKGEYEIFEWDLGSTFNYAEMAALIAPKPFMVERGHNDGVAPDETVAYEYAKVHRIYAKLGIADKTTIEFFNGPHSINGKGTFDFLHKHLDWPKP